MAARRVMRIAEQRRGPCGPRPAPPRASANGEWRTALAPSAGGYGPLRDRPDWAFLDGRPAPLWRGQLRRLRENEEMARRAVKLSRVLEAAVERGGGGEGPPTPRLRPKGSQRPPVRTSTDQ